MKGDKQRSQYGKRGQKRKNIGQGQDSQTEPNRGLGQKEEQAEEEEEQQEPQEESGQGSQRQYQQGEPGTQRHGSPQGQQERRRDRP